MNISAVAPKYRVIYYVIRMKKKVKREREIVDWKRSQNCDNRWENMRSIVAKEKLFFIIIILILFSPFFSFSRPTLLHGWYTFFTHKICAHYLPLFFFSSYDLPLSTVCVWHKNKYIYFYGELLMKRFVLLLNVWFTSARIYCWLKLSLLSLLKLTGKASIQKFLKNSNLHLKLEGW